MKFFLALICLIATQAELCVAAEKANNPAWEAMQSDEEPTYKTTFPEAPGMIFDVPKDAKIFKKNNSFQVETASQYMFRKSQEQSKRLDEFGQTLGDFGKELDAIKKEMDAIKALLPPPKKKVEEPSLRSVEETVTSPAERAQPGS